MMSQADAAQRPGLFHLTGPDRLIDRWFGCPSGAKPLSNSIKVHIKAAPATSKTEQHASTRCKIYGTVLLLKGWFIFPLNLQIQERRNQKKVPYYERTLVVQVCELSSDFRGVHHLKVTGGTFGCSKADDPTLSWGL